MSHYHGYTLFLYAYILVCGIYNEDNSFQWKKKIMRIITIWNIYCKSDDDDDEVVLADSKK